MKPTLWNKPSYLGLKFDCLSLCQETIQCHLQLCKISFIQRLFTDNGLIQNFNEKQIQNVLHNQEIF